MPWGKVFHWLRRLWLFFLRHLRMVPGSVLVHPRLWGACFSGCVGCGFFFPWAFVIKGVHCASLYGLVPTWDYAFLVKTCLRGRLCTSFGLDTTVCLFPSPNVFPYRPHPSLYECGCSKHISHGAWVSHNNNNLVEFSSAAGRKKHPVGLVV